MVTFIWEGVPRASLTTILQVSQEWSQTALAIPSLWTDLHFGPGHTPEDLDVARRWIGRAAALPLTTTIENISNVEHRTIIPLLGTLHIQEHNTLELFHFLQVNRFDLLQSLVAVVETPRQFVYRSIVIVKGAVQN
ncbi:hypothetical protein B0H14DRAFT_2641581 [Mycena olivaceomarginata]|nr:hypothetical protein B0H14DRAFT_2641581 [Mycena olivaceomarginata]